MPRVFDLRARQEVNRGFSDALVRSVEIVLTPIVFGLMGGGIDRVAGTSPAFTAILAAFGVIGVAVKMKLGYDREMAAHDGVATAPRQVAPRASNSRLSR